MNFTRVLHVRLILAFTLIAACGGKTETPTNSMVGSAGSSPSSKPSLSGFPSCKDNRDGANAECGANHDLDCCDSLAVPGGTFLRDNNPSAPATISPFRLDRFEVTVGRFRTFVEAYPGSKPKEGDGAHPKIPGSGWRKEWNKHLPDSPEALRKNLSFLDETALQPGFSKKDLLWMIPWTEQENKNENLAMTNLVWSLAFAFCAWDGGRLPTEAEWVFAALGGGEQRKYPWGDAPIDDTTSAFYNNVFKEKKLRQVGSALAGAARWGHLDLTGGATEVVFDAISGPDFYVKPCSDCALLDREPSFGDARRLKDYGEPTSRSGIHMDEQNLSVGVRCARD